MSNTSHEHWMRIALEEAKKALEANELPIGGALVSNGTLLRTSQTSVRRRGSMVAHGELIGLLDANGSLYTAAHPVVVYTTLEPCLMCLGAIMQCGVDEVVYGMRCKPDGAIQLVGAIAAAGQPVPKVTSGVLEVECVELFRKWNLGTGHPAHGYVTSVLAEYGS